MVEKKSVQDSRRRIWLDAQKIQWGSFAKAQCLAGRALPCLVERVAPPRVPGVQRAGNAGSQERAELMPMPTPFDGYVENPARVSSTCLGHGGTQPLLGAV